MTPKEKALQLVTNFYIEINFDFVSNDNWIDPSSKNESKKIKKDAKRCALLCVDEIISIDKEKPYQISGIKLKFYKEVRKEIEKL